MTIVVDANIARSVGTDVGIAILCADLLQAIEKSWVSICAR